MLQLYSGPECISQPFKISQRMCTLMDGPIFACASWAAADSFYLTNYFFRHKDLRPDCVPTTPTRRPTTSCLEKGVHQMALFHYAVASCWRLKAQRDTWPNNLHPSYMSQPGVKLIRPWSDVTGTERILGGGGASGDAEQKYHTTLSKLLLCLI